MSELSWPAASRAWNTPPQADDLVAVVPPRHDGVGRPLRLARTVTGDLHYRLLGLGLSHRAAVLVLYGLSLSLSLVALMTMQTR